MANAHAGNRVTYLVAFSSVAHSLFDVLILVSRFLLTDTRGFGAFMLVTGVALLLFHRVLGQLAYGQGTKSFPRLWSCIREVMVIRLYLVLGAALVLVGLANLLW